MWEASELIKSLYVTVCNALDWQWSASCAKYDIEECNKDKKMTTNSNGCWYGE